MYTPTTNTTANNVIKKESSWQDWLYFVCVFGNIFQLNIKSFNPLKGEKFENADFSISLKTNFFIFNKSAYCVQNNPT